MILSRKTLEITVQQTTNKTDAQTTASCHIHHLHNVHTVCLYICILCIHVMSMCLLSICMSVQTVAVCVHVEMQLQLIYGLNTVNTRFTIVCIIPLCIYIFFKYFFGVPHLATFIFVIFIVCM